MLLAGGLGQQGMGSAAGAVAGYGGRLCGQGAAEYAAGGARAAVINDRELRSEALRRAEQREREAMAVDDSRRGREQSTDASDVGFDRFSLAP